MGAFVGAARNYQAGDSDDRPCPGERRSLAARQCQKDAVASPNNNLLAAIFSLSPFKRFVFVMSVLKGSRRLP